MSERHRQRPWWHHKFYSSSKWRKVRLLALERDGYTCRRCDASACTVHHTVYLNEENWIDPSVSLNLELLESLCFNCHAVEHGRLEERTVQKFDAEGYLIENEIDLVKSLMVD